MLPDAIELEIVTPERLVLHERVQSVELPGADGYMGILPGHAPLMTELGIGILAYRKDAGARYLSVIQGYAEVLPDRVIVLAEISERAEEIDVSRAEDARGRAERELARPDADWAKANLALARSLARRQAAGRMGAGQEPITAP